MEKNALNPEEWHKVLYEGRKLEEIVKEVLFSKYVKIWCSPVLKLTSPNDKILELGSGRGVLSAYLSMKKRETYLLDFSNENLLFSQKLFELLNLNGIFIYHNVLYPFPFPDNFFDCVWSCGLLEHFSNSQISYIIRESERVSKKYIISMVPNALSLPYRIGKCIMEKKKKWIYGKETPFFSMKKFTPPTLKIVSEISFDLESALYYVNNFKWGEIFKIGRYFSPIFEKIFRQGYLLVTVWEKM